MRFRLKYDGRLLAATEKKSHKENKNEIRWKLNDQLMNLILEGDFSRLPKRPKADEEQSPELSKYFFKGFGFFPVVSSRNYSVVCNLSIHLERRDIVGGILTREGDLDNRIKTLLDALQMPQNENEVLPPKDLKQKTCYCLLENDAMVSGLNIQTVTSLEELPKNHVKLTIDVEVRPHDLTYHEED